MSPPAALNTLQNQVSEENRCKYSSKRCDFPRSFKRNGELHRFCDYHRMKANINQRRVDQRRKAQRALGISSPTSAQDPQLMALPDVTWYEDLDPQDLEYLDRLLSSEEEQIAAEAEP
ncbi:hypothetical protein PHYSODRAFT_299801 [Phytophthora sojae]|uniref:Uncharacterized protein n=1 Tax=Phytophthora sojae (strain P6497) TaxID=1094619 RepID=G4Z9H4_PHYSP|nr:hypothetical protein PHYSODRAFT_299801 [Phytophthora sojae]EGZ22606.1 hypothetical protein PHYSODRAFT_299801 [Phytophthora sojae]|eukprot:XP_009525323.1 hypothetical protein PHYSODRAFT_299801 [Phytophthora sojae]